MPPWFDPRVSLEHRAAGVLDLPRLRTVRDEVQYAADRLIGHYWCRVSHRLVTRLRPRTNLKSMLVVRVEFEAGIRGSALAPGHMVEWGFDRTLLQIVLAPGERNELTVTRMLRIDAEDLGLDDEGLSEELAQAWSRQQAWRRPPDERTEIVLVPGGGANLFHELVDHGLEALQVLSGQSPFAKLRFDDRVSIPELTVLDSPASVYGPRDLIVDDEGQPVQEVTADCQGSPRGLAA